MATSSSTLRIGVIGFGQWGPNHVRNFRMIDDCDVVRACDLSSARLALARKQFRDLETTTGPAAITMAPDVDAVIVATPVHTHVALVRQALEQGKDGLCEKPLAATVSECRELCTLAAAPVEVSATGGFFLQEKIEDIGFLTLHYPKGVICHVHTSWLNPRKVRHLTIVGDHKMAVWDDMNNLEPIRYYDKGVTADHYSSFGEFQMILRDGAITIPKVRMFEPLLRQDEDFVECVRARRTPAASCEFGLGVVHVIEAAVESMRHRGRVTPVARS